MESMLKIIITKMLLLSRPAKRSVALIFDVFLCALSVYLAYYLRLGDFIGLSGGALIFDYGANICLGLSIILSLPIFIVNGFYRAIFRYSGWHALLAVAKATSCYGFLYAIIVTFFGISSVPRTIGLIQPILLFILVGASRLFVRLLLREEYKNRISATERQKVLIYGAGIIGQQVASLLENNCEVNVIGFIDDNKKFHGSLIQGLIVYPSDNIDTLVHSLQIKTVLLALPNINRKRRNEIINNLIKAHVCVRSIPNVIEIAQGSEKLSEIRDLDVDDLLARDPISLNSEMINEFLFNKTIMVTGAGGSIGTELCRQIIQASPKRILLIEISEHALYTIHQEFLNLSNFPSIYIVPLLASVQDTQRIKEIIQTWKPDIIFHAAAYKHVPLVEHNPIEGIKNNFYGTLNVALIALENTVANFVLISTDKAVNPSNIMGASKRLSELLMQSIDPSNSTKFTVVRFGNVLDSSGSVIPKFRQQIKKGGPVTITHPETTRYFMTLKEAAQLVIQAASIAKGSEIFLLDMGEPIKIIDLARRLIELSGLLVRDSACPYGDIEIDFIGMRPGEKIHEELFIDASTELSEHPKIMKIKERAMEWVELRSHIERLSLSINESDLNTTREILKEIIKNYDNTTEVFDWVYTEKGHNRSNNHNSKAVI